MKCPTCSLDQRPVVQTSEHLLCDHGSSMSQNGSTVSVSKMMGTWIISLAYLPLVELGGNYNAKLKPWISMKRQVCPGGLKSQYPY